ncbi:MAG: carbohydrate ABC transporter permease [Spirochaetaceae bacterium]|jgi:putative aldouronate transport system permease protein|nr:carbohydrate ABC transporter permease [Spirochaetaceae bacterium]
MKEKREFVPGMKVREETSIGTFVMQIITYVFFTAFALFCVYPFYYMFINSISNNLTSSQGKVLFFPIGIHFTNYVSAFKIPELANAAMISLGRTVIGTVFTLIASAFLGFMFTRETMWKRKVWYRLVVVTMYFNAGLIPWYLIMRNLGLTNNFWAYLLPTIVVPFDVILAKTFVESVPKSLEESATLDGAGTFTVFGAIILPLIKPILTTIAIFAAVNQWNAFQDTLLLMTDSRLYSLQFVLYQYLQGAASVARNANSSSMMASLATAATQTSIRMTVTIIVVLPILAVYPFFQRYFVKGIMIGAVKG